MKTALSQSNRIRLIIYFIAWTSLLGTFAREPVQNALAETDFTVREEMITMRDGVGLYTLILEPADPAGPLPVILLRTPYSAARACGDLSVSSLKAVIEQTCRAIA